MPLAHAHQPAPVDPVGQHARRQQGAGHAEQVEGLGGGRQQRRPGERVGQQREDEHAHPAAELADGLADPEHGEVVVAGEVR